jgi:competence protein ComEC
VLEPHRGEILRLGALRLRVLNPETKDIPAAGDSSGEDPNDRAIVLLASYGNFDMFLPADAESNVTLSLPLRRVEVLKVAHHGSVDEGLPELLDRLRPRAAVIEVGAGNPFGHPRKETLAALGASVPDVFRTDRDGDVRFSVDRRGVAVSTAD